MGDVLNDWIYYDEFILDLRDFGAVLETFQGTKRHIYAFYSCINILVTALNSCISMYLFQCYCIK